MPHARSMPPPVAIGALVLSAIVAFGCADDAPTAPVRVPSDADGDTGALHAIAKQGYADEADTATLDAAMRDGDTGQRATAAWAAGVVRASGAADALIELARGDDSADVRINAARALGSVDHPHAESTLVALLDHPEILVRGAALHGLASPSRAGACETVCAYVPRAGDELRAVAIDTLLAMDGSCTRRCLVAAAGDPLAEVRSLVAFGLGRLGARDQLDLLVRMLGDADPHVRANAAQALGMLGLATARPHLETAARDEYGVVQDAAKQALGKLP